MIGVMLSWQNIFPFKLTTFYNMHSQLSLTSEMEMRKKQQDGFMIMFSLCSNGYTCGTTNSSIVKIATRQSNMIVQRLASPWWTFSGHRAPFFLNMDQTAIYSESWSNYSVAKKGATNVLPKGNSIDSKQWTIAADGTKLPPFFIFKGVQGGP
jgi:hypothetical protein